MGSPGFAVPALMALLEAGHDVCAVYSQPPRPAGRGHKERPCPVHALAMEKGLEARTPESLEGAAERDVFAAVNADIAVVAAYGLILPKPFLEAPRLGCVNIHASLLPRWRGAAPIQRAVLAGDAETGVTIMQMDEGLDTGPMLLAEAMPITPGTTASSLHDALSAMGARLIVRVLEDTPSPTPQAPPPVDGGAYAKKLTRGEGRLDWSRPARELERAVRALNPWPGVWFECEGERIKVLAAEVSESAGEPGAVLGDLTVACGSGALILKRLQRPGKAPMDAKDFLRGHPFIQPGGSLN